MTQEISNSIRREKLTALCNHCGETVKEWFSAVRGLGWNCMHWGYEPGLRSGASSRSDPMVISGGVK